MESLKNWIDGLRFDFVGKRKAAAIMSTIWVVASWILFVVVGPNWGIDFTGGTEIQLQFEQPVMISEVRSALATLGLSDDAVQQLGGTADPKPQFMVSIQDPEFGLTELVTDVRQRLDQTFGADWVKDVAVSAEVGARLTIAHAPPEVKPQDVAAALVGIEGVNVSGGKDENQVIVTVPGLSQLIEHEISQAMGDRQFEVQAVDAVGPKVGGDLRQQGFVAVVATLALVLVYIAFRFDLAFAPGAILSLVHDVSVTVGIFTILQLEFSVPMIGALLTIIGVSLNDTIVIYDRIREMRDRYRRTDLTELINNAINETLTRTIATNTTQALAMAPFLIFGAPVIRNFAIAMVIGMIFGTYSTVYVASPMILIMEDLKPMLGRFIALPTLSGPGPSDAAPPPASTIADNGPDDDDGQGPDGSAGAENLSESEKRRRERAEAGRKGTT